MKTMIDNLKNLIKKSNLTKKQKEIWDIVLRVLPDQGRKEILEALEENPEYLQFLTDNLVSKIEGFSKGNKKILDKVLKEEKDYLEKI